MTDKIIEREPHSLCLDDNCPEMSRPSKEEGSPFSGLFVRSYLNRDRITRQCTCWTSIHQVNASQGCLTFQPFAGGSMNLLTSEWKHQSDWPSKFESFKGLSALLGVYPGIEKIDRVDQRAEDASTGSLLNNVVCMNFFSFGLRPPPNRLPFFFNAACPSNISSTGSGPLRGQHPILPCS